MQRLAVTRISIQSQNSVLVDAGGGHFLYSKWMYIVEFSFNRLPVC
jgi:hypothetical protein